jgi:hypothetical protein
MRPKFHLRFVDKAAAALTSAVEVYNKPSFAYREETFAILALNAWELLLKAKVLKEASDAVKALRVYEYKPLKSGRPSKKATLRLNRAGNALSISLWACVGKLDGTPGQLAAEVKGNLEALTAIRDNSIHYVTASATLSRQAQELAAASVKNFTILAKQWFKRDLSAALNLVLPLSFVAIADDVNSVVVSQDERRLVRHLQQLAAAAGETDGEFAVAVRLEVKLEKSKLATASKVELTKGDPTAVKIAITEQDLLEKYPWDYATLLAKLTVRYTDFKANKKFHQYKKPMLGDERFQVVRLLNPKKLQGIKQTFWSPNVFTVFDQHYTKA